MKYKVTLNGKTYEVEVEQGKAVLLDEYEALAPAPAAAAVPVAAPAAAPVAAPAASAAPVNLEAGEAVNAPMPGNILRIDVAKGDTVKAGQVLAILEAMKMEIPVVAPEDGTVASIDVAVGDAIEAGAVLATLN